MDLQTRKLNAIEFLIGLQDERMLSKIEATMREGEDKSLHHAQPFTKAQWVERAGKANADYALGKYKTQEQMERESENW